MKHEHKLIFNGLPPGRGRLEMALVNKTTALLVTGIEQALTLQLDGHCKSGVKFPKSLRPATRVAMAFDGAHGQLTFFASPLASSLPDRFRQQTLFDDSFDARSSPLDLFEDALELALRGDTNGPLYDRALLKTFCQFENLKEFDVDSVSLVNGRTIQVDDQGLERMKVIVQSAAHPSKRVAIAGTLEAIAYSKCRFALKLGTGTTVAGTAVELGTETLKQYFGKAVLVIGLGVYRPDGEILRIEADSIQLATAQEIEGFGNAPKSAAAVMLRAIRTRGGRREPLSFPPWPGNETDEEFAQMLKELR